MNPKTKQNKSHTKIGIPFYTREDWKILIADSKDDFGFQSYEEMREKNLEIKSYLEKSGYDVVEMPIDVNKMIRHFRENKLENNGKNRSEYFVDRVRELRQDES